jgi:hypothetical protein
VTEAEWLACGDPLPMLFYLGRRASDRKLRLFACACCRISPGLPKDSTTRDIIGVVERFADGQADDAELEVARASAASRIRGAGRVAWFWRALRDLGQPTIWQIPEVTRAVATPRAVNGGPVCGRHLTVERGQANLLRHILGNPFRPPITVSASSDSIHLARAVYDGDLGACGPLHDALLEDGLPELAAHFWQPPASWLGRVWKSLRRPEPHPKGCWALDAILRKDSP